MREDDRQYNLNQTKVQPFHRMIAWNKKTKKKETVCQEDGLPSWNQMPKGFLGEKMSQMLRLATKKSGKATFFFQ